MQDEHNLHEAGRHILAFQIFQRKGNVESPFIIEQETKILKFVSLAIQLSKIMNRCNRTADSQLLIPWGRQAMIDCTPSLVVQNVRRATSRKPSTPDLTRKHCCVLATNGDLECMTSASRVPTILTNKTP